MSTLPTTPSARKAVPIQSGVLDYFPDAIAAVAQLSLAGNVQHNGEGAPLRWDRSKSGDEADALQRHQMERGTFDSDGIRHSAKVAWRALAQLQKELEAAGAPLSRGSFYSTENPADEPLDGPDVDLTTGDWPGMIRTVPTMSGRMPCGDPTCWCAGARS